MAGTMAGRFTALLAAAFLIASTNAVCPRVKTSMETWDWGPLSNTVVKFTNHTAKDGNNQWTTHLCDGVFSNAHDFGVFAGGSGSIKFHQPSDTFYMSYSGGDRGGGCEATPRQADVYIHCQGCPAYLLAKNDACTLSSAPCVCAAFEKDCIGEVHMVVNCPAGIPNYRLGFDVYDASTGIEEDISKVVIKDGEVMPGWTDEDRPSVAHDRAVIPGNVESAVFYLMMADEDLKGLPPSQEIDAPDVFTDQPHVLAVTLSGSAAAGGVVDTQEMLKLQLDFHCYQTGLADVHVEISFANKYYPCDFAFTYECGIGASARGGGHSFGTMLFFLILFGFLGGCAYNYFKLNKRGEEIVPGIVYLHMAKEIISELISRASAFRPAMGGGASNSGSTEGYQAL